METIGHSQGLRNVSLGRTILFMKWSSLHSMVGNVARVNEYSVGCTTTWVLVLVLVDKHTAVLSSTSIDLTIILACEGKHNSTELQDQTTAEVHNSPPGWFAESYRIRSTKSWWSHSLQSTRDRPKLSRRSGSTHTFGRLNIFAVYVMYTFLRSITV